MNKVLATLESEVPRELTLSVHSLNDSGYYPVTIEYQGKNFTSLYDLDEDAEAIATALLDSTDQKYLHIDEKDFKGLAICLPIYKVVAVDESDDFVEGYLESIGVEKFEAIYVFNANEVTHLCSFQSSYWLEAIDYRVEHLDPDDETARDNADFEISGIPELLSSDYFSGSFDDAVIFDPLSENDIKNYLTGKLSHEEAMDIAIAYARNNPVF